MSSAINNKRENSALNFEPNYEKRQVHLHAHRHTHKHALDTSGWRNTIQFTHLQNTFETFIRIPAAVNLHVKVHRNEQYSPRGKT